MCDPPSLWLLGALWFLFLLPKDSFPKSSQDSEAAELQVSLQVPEESGRNEPPASRGLMASALLQPFLFLEVASLKILGFSSLLVFLLYCRRNWVAGIHVKDKGIFQYICARSLSQPARESAQTPPFFVFIFQLEFSNVISKKTPAQPCLCKHCNHHSISATLSCELI